VKSNLLVWCLHSCRRDVFLEELSRGHLANYRSIVDRGLFASSAIVGGHFQKTSHPSEITGRVCSSPVSPTLNILNSVRAEGGFAGVVNDFVIASWSKQLVAEGRIGSVGEVYPNLIEQPTFANTAYPKLEFHPDLNHRRWLYWYRQRATHRHFYNFALNFERDGGFLEDVVNENPSFVRDQQRYALRLQDRWFGDTLRYLEEHGVLEETIVLCFSSHGTSLEGWLPLMKRVTKATVDHGALNFHPNVSRSFAFMAGPGIPHRSVDEWTSILDLKPTLCRALGIEDAGGSSYGLDLIRDEIPEQRILADVSRAQRYSLYEPRSGWLFMALPEERKPDGSEEGLPPSPGGFVAFNLLDDGQCSTPRSGDFLDSPERAAFRDEARRLSLLVPIE
jgi:hypothetical protein